MKFKLDENFGAQCAGQFTAAGHDVCTVWEQQCQGATDEKLYAICLTENRCLVTFDLDFANPMRFPPEGGAGLAVFRLSGRVTLLLLRQTVQTLLEGMVREPIAGKLWIVEPGRIRIHAEKD